MNLSKTPKEYKPKIVFLDLECSPQESMTYGPFHEASILSIVKAPYLFCFSYADIEGGKSNVVALPDFPLYKKDPTNDLEVCKKLYEVMESADTIVAHNVAFDVRLAHARFMAHKMPPIRPVRTICTLQMARRVASFPSNSLKELALFLGVKHKMETSKYLWQKILLHKDLSAWKEMKLYNRIDTEVGIQLYWVLMAWSGKLKTELYPGAFCKGCGSNDVTWRGPTLTKRLGKRFQCAKCKMWGQIFI